MSPEHLGTLAHKWGIPDFYKKYRHGLFIFLHQGKPFVGKIIESNPAGSVATMQTINRTSTHGELWLMGQYPIAELYIDLTLPQPHYIQLYGHSTYFSYNPNRHWQRGVTPHGTASHVTGARHLDRLFHKWMTLDTGSDGGFRQISSIIGTMRRAQADTLSSANGVYQIFYPKYESFNIACNKVLNGSSFSEAWHPDFAIMRSVRGPHPLMIFYKSFHVGDISPIGAYTLKPLAIELTQELDRALSQKGQAWRV